MSGQSLVSRPGGVLTTILGGLAGATIGVLVAIPVGNANATGGLEALGTVLGILLLALTGGAALGVGVGLVIAGHPRPIVTAFLSLPAMMAAVLVAVRLMSSLNADWWLGLPLLIVTAAISLWLARALATIGRHKRRPDGQGRVTSTSPPPHP